MKSHFTDAIILDVICHQRLNKLIPVRCRGKLLVGCGVGFQREPARCEACQEGGVEEGCVAHAQAGAESRWARLVIEKYSMPWLPCVDPSLTG